MADGPETFYTPWQVRTLLRILPALATGRHVQEGPDTSSGKRTNRPHWWPQENAIVIHADLDQALQSLPWFTRQVVYRHYVLGQPRSHIAAVLRCDRETVTRHCEDGTGYISWLLGYRTAPNEKWRSSSRQRSPLVWRHPDLEDDSCRM